MAFVTGRGLAAAVVLTAFILAAPPVLSAQETVEAAFDSRTWKLGSQDYNQEKKATMKMFVPEDETIESWQELITLQFFEGLQQRLTIDQFLQKMQGGLKAACPSLKWNTVSQEQDDAVYMWNIKGCQSQPDQTEITRVVAGREGMHIWHYAAKDPDLALEKQREWIDRLNQFRLKN